jgi:hypothetical protein
MLRDICGSHVGGYENCYVLWQHKTVICSDIACLVLGQLQAFCWYEATHRLKQNILNS